VKSKPFAERPRIDVSFHGFRTGFASAAELRQSLRDALAEGKPYNVPYIRFNRDDDDIAFRWLGQLVWTRSDWLPCAAAALLDVAANGTELEHQALVDLLGNEPAVVRLLPWTQALAQTHGDLRASRWGFGGGPWPRLDAILEHHRKYYLDSAAPRSLVEVARGKAAKAASGSVADELRAALAASAKRGPGRDRWASDPRAWHWLWPRAAYRDDVCAAMAECLAAALASEQLPLVCAALDWLDLGIDLHRWAPVVAGLQWPAALADVPARVKPVGWKSPMLLARSHGSPATLGAALARTQAAVAGQLETPPELDLPLPPFRSVTEQR
jgi:hypothetical protein